MADETDLLGLPLLMPAQAQKHVTHNEALALLDVLVQLAVLDRNRQSPPPAAVQGDRHLVAAAALADWAGHEGQIACLGASGWQFILPRPGWQAHVLAEAQMVVFDGLQWRAPLEGPVAITRLGIGGASPDAVNRLAVASAATLFSHAGAGHQLKLNKQAASDTASLLFQSNWSGRAEMGTVGSDAFAIKVSADGSSWATGLQLTPASGRVDFPNGLTRAGAALYGRDNLLGPVAQLGGLPSGAVIERDSTANGGFVRFADGTLICTSAGLSASAATTAAGSGFRSANVSWSFPASFASGLPPVVSGMVEDIDCWLAAAAPSISGVSLRAMALISKAGALPLRAMAVGRWF